MVNEESLKHVGWPSRHYFDNDLKNERISDDDWAHVKKVFTMTRCHTIGDYSKLYLTLDTCLLCDVIINHCKTSRQVFGLDPLHFVSLPGFAMTCMRYFTRETRLQYFLDPNQMLRTLPAIRGGIQSVVCRLKKANVPGTPDFDVSKPAGEIACLDVNQLYASTYKKKLPVGSYTTMSQLELDEVFNNGRIDLSRFGGRVGAFLAVNLKYPKDKAWQDKYRS